MRVCARCSVGSHLATCVNVGLQGDCRGRTVYGFSQPRGAAGDGDDPRTEWNVLLGLACAYAICRIPGDVRLEVGTISLIHSSKKYQLLNFIMYINKM